MSTTWIRKASPQTAAAMASPLSRPLTPPPKLWTGAIRVIGAGAGAAAEGPAGFAAPAAGAACPGFGAGGAGDAPAGAPAAGAGEGSRTVGAAVGFGGNEIRTVSFLGWTLAASPGVGGTGVGGMLGTFSDIVVPEPR